MKVTNEQIKKNDLLLLTRAVPAVCRHYEKRGMVSQVSCFVYCCQTNMNSLVFRFSGFSDFA